MQKLYFTDVNRRQGFCGVDIYRTPQGTVVVMTELDGNPAMSVTNAVELIATTVVKNFKIEHPEQVTWLEYSVPDVRGFEDTDEYAQVRFTWTNKVARSPRWQYISPQDAWKLINRQ